MAEKRVSFEKLYAVWRVAEMLEVGCSTIYEAIQRGELGHVIIGKRAYRIPESALQKFIDERYRRAHVGGEE